MSKGTLRSNIGVKDEIRAHQLIERYLIKMGMEEGDFLMSAERKDLSDETIVQLELKKSRIYEERFEDTKEFIVSNRSKIEMLQDALLKNEILKKEEILKIIGQMKV